MAPPDSARARARVRGDILFKKRRGGSYLWPHQTQRHVLGTIVPRMKLPHHLTDLVRITAGVRLSCTMSDGAYITGAEFFVRMAVDDAVFGHLQGEDKG